MKRLIAICLCVLLVCLVTTVGCLAGDMGLVTGSENGTYYQFGLDLQKVV